jgi:hypothetical protein
MREIKGAMSAQEAGEDRFLPVENSDAYRASARALMEGVRVLARGPSSAAIALTFVAGQVTECGLKSLLARSMPLKDVVNLGHDLVALRDAAIARGINLPPSLSPWLDDLARLHRSPYNLRYPMELH